MVSVKLSTHAFIFEYSNSILMEILVSVMLYLINNGSGGFTCAGDINDDGETDVTDLLGVIADWGCIEEGLPD